MTTLVSGSTGPVNYTEVVFQPHPRKYLIELNPRTRSTTPTPTTTPIPRTARMDQGIDMDEDYAKFNSRSTITTAFTLLTVFIVAGLYLFGDKTCHFLKNLGIWTLFSISIIRFLILTWPFYRHYLDVSHYLPELAVPNITVGQLPTLNTGLVVTITSIIVNIYLIRSIIYSLGPACKALITRYSPYNAPVPSNNRACI